MKYRPDIDGLRAVAIVPVVLYHAGLPGPSGGYVGVDVFFVISGFLITRIVADEIGRGSFSLLSFYERRARRILPALTAVVLACFALGWIVLLPAELEDLGQSALAAGLFLSNVYFMLVHDYFARAAELAPLLHTWSLAVEEQFYLVFPVLLVVLAGQRGGRRRTVWIVAGLSALSLAAAMVLIAPRPEWVFYLIFFRMWELGAGALLALAAPPAPASRRLREALAAAALAAIVVPVFLYDSATPFPGLAAVPPVLGAALLILVGSAGGGSRVTAWLSGRAIVWIGLISYSLYLWHWPILAFLRVILDVAVLPLPLGLAGAAVSVAVAWLSYRYVEQPFRARPPRGYRRRTILAGAACSIGGVVGIGAALHLMEGVPERLSPKARAMAHVALDSNAAMRRCFDRVPADERCALGAENGRGGKFLLWGDSHALAIVPALDLAAANSKRRGYFLGATGCPPIRDATPDWSDGFRCAGVNAEILTWLKARPDISTVVLAARWPFFVEGSRFLFETGGPIAMRWTGEAAAPGAAADNAALVAAGLRSTLAELAAMDRQVIVVGPVPEAGRNVPASAARAAHLGWQRRLTVPAPMVRARLFRTEAILAEAVSAHGNARYLPVSDLLCGSESCDIFGADGRPLYYDDDHLTATAARALLTERLRDIWR